MKYLLFLLLLFKSIHGYKILVFSPTNSVSHVISNGRIGDTLALDNHDVTILEAEFRVPSKPAKYAKKVVLGGFNASVFDAGQASLTADTFTGDYSFLNHLSYDPAFFDAFNEQCDAMLTMHKDKLEELSKEKFDLLIAEQLNLCGVGLKHILKIPSLIWVSSCPLDDHMAYYLAVPTPLSYVPAVGDVVVSDQMSYFGRIQNWLEFYKDVRSYGYGMTKTNEIFKKHYGPDFPDLIETARDADLIFVLADEFLDFPRPILHNTIYIGGFGLSKSTIGSTAFIDELAKDKSGIVFFSLGTNIDTVTIPEEVKRNLFTAASKFPQYQFVLKFDADDEFAIKLSKNYENIKVVDWIDQPALLSDSRLKLFITHGGYNSLLEAVNFAKPLLLMPLFGDQYRNAKLAERNGFGRFFEKKTLMHTPSDLIQLLTEMLKSEKYNEAAVRIQKLVKSKPLNATERLWRYTRFLLENDGKLPELQIEGKKLPLYVYFNLDIFIPIAVFSLVFPYLCLLIIRNCVARQIQGNHPSTESTKRKHRRDSMNNAKRRRRTKSPAKISDEENIDPAPHPISKKIRFAHSLPSDVLPKKLNSKNFPRKSNILEIDEIEKEVDEPVSKSKKNHETKRNRKNSSNFENIDDSKIDAGSSKASSSDAEQELIGLSDSKFSFVDGIDTVKLFAASVDLRGGFLIDNYHSDRVVRFRYTAQTKKIPKFPQFFNADLDPGKCFVCFFTFLDHEAVRSCWEENCRMRCHEYCLSKMKFGSYTSFHATIDEPEFQGKVHCPMHHCNKCYADHLHTRAYQAPNTFVKCRLCISYFHPSCIPAGCEIDKEKTIICPRHIKMEVYRHRPTAYCAQCNEKDESQNLIMCSNCPRSFHQKCNKSLSYIPGSPYGERCDFCVDNCFALVGDKVYAQYGGYGYYPAIVVPNERIYRLKRSVPVGSLAVEWVVNGTHTLAVVNHYQIIPSCFGSFFFKFPSLRKIEEHGEFNEDVAKNNMRLQKQLDHCHKRSRNRTVKIVTKMVLTDDVKLTKKEKIHEKCSCPPSSNGKERCNTEFCENRRMGVECPPSCKCSNRLSAHVYSKLKVLPTDDRGFGLYAKSKISKEAYIGEYCGELVTEEEHSRRRIYDRTWASRDKGFYMFQLGKLYIDAALIGSILRFANHSCDPNCIMRILRDCSGLDHICMYALRDIEPNEELTFNYSGSFAGNGVLATYDCYCGTQKCTGTFAV